MSETDSNWRPTRAIPAANRRFEWLLWALLAWVLAIFCRLIWLQVLHHDELLKLAQQQQQKTVEIQAVRGTIFDRTGQPLAKTLPAESICVNPAKIPDVGVAADLLSRLLEMDRKKLYEKISAAHRRSSGFLWVKRKVDAGEANRVRSLKLDWVEFREETRRFYPRGRMASHMVGSTGMLDDGSVSDDKEHGTAGIEAALDEDLSGRPGAALVYTDVRQNPYDSIVSREPQAGADITLTIDPNLQFVVERELDKAMLSSGAKTGSIVALNPYTGELLAVANAPRFDPNLPPSPKEPISARSDLAVSTPYEPGSVFKIVTLAAALETTNMTPQSAVFCYNGTFKFHGRVIHDTHSYGTLTMADVLAKSSNIGAIQFGLAVGDKMLYEYVRKFGFGAKTGIELPGESAGMVRRLKDWEPGSIASISFGHEISTTALQLATAGAVIANGGMLVKPQILLSRRKPGGEMEPIPHEPGVRAIKPETAILLRQMMEGVVLHGTGKAATLKGYTSAGKTGSAQIFDFKTKTYTHTYNSSFLGFAPVANPQIVIAVTLNATAGGAAGYGGAVAAPVFREVATAALRMLDVPKDLPDSLLRSETESGEKPVSSVTQPPVQVGAPTSVDSSRLSANLTIPGGPQDSSPLDRRPFSGPGIKVPDFRGMTLRAVLEESAAQGLPVEVDGDGIARTQDPPPGTRIPVNGQVRIQFGR
jgi:cell division protein FtsI (penicillin-binding protein 3)